MSSNQVSRKARQVPKFLNETGKVLGVDSVDMFYLLLPAVLFPMVTYYIAGITPLPGQAPIVATAISLLLVPVAIQQKPTHLDAKEWYNAIWNGITTPKRMVHITTRGGDDQPTRDYVEGENWIDEHFSTTGRTQQQTGVDELYPGAGVAKIDGREETWVTAVRIEPTNMALATGEEWRQRHRAFSNFLNSLDWPIQIYSTTSSFDIDTHLEMLSQRQHDADIQSRPILQQLLYSYRTQFLPAVAGQDIKQQSYYILIPATRTDIFGTRSEQVQRRLATRLPIIRRLISDTPGEDQSADEDDVDAAATVQGKSRVMDEMRERQAVARTGIGSIPGCEAVPVEGGELPRIIHEYWSGRDMSAAANGAFMRSLPVSTGGDVDMEAQQVDGETYSEET